MRSTTHHNLVARLAVILSLFWMVEALVAADLDRLRSSLTFHASFDSGAEADRARGDRQIHTAATLARENISPGLPDHVVTVPEGRWGGGLRFLDVSESVVLYQGKDNVPYDTQGFELTVSFWLRVDPEKGLKPGYVDPLQITDKKWNDASLFVDFTKDDRPRHFRLGVFSDYSHWNPSNTKWEEVSAELRPMVVVTEPKFSTDRWTHVAFAVSNLNADKSNGVARLYLDGRPQGARDGDYRFTWSTENLAIMLGIQYIGDLDDLAIFSSALSPQEIRALHALDGGVGELR